MVYLGLVDLLGGLAAVILGSYVAFLIGFLPRDAEPTLDAELPLEAEVPRGAATLRVPVWAP